MKKLSILLLFFCAGLSLAAMYPSAPVAAQNYVVKKDKDTGFFGRLFGRGKKEEQQKTKNTVQDKTVVKPKSKEKSTTADAFKIVPVEPTEPVYDYDHDDKLDMKAFMEEAIGKCTPQDRKTYESFKEMQAQFDEDMEEMQKKGGKMPEGYKLPEGEDPEDYEELIEELTEEELMEKLQPETNTMHGLLAQDGRMEQVMGVAMRCADMKEETAKVNARQREREAKRALRPENRR